MSQPFSCVDCNAYCEGRDPHPGEVDEQCFTCWVAAGWGRSA